MTKSDLYLALTEILSLTLQLSNIKGAANSWGKHKETQTDSQGYIKLCCEVYPNSSNLVKKNTIKAGGSTATKNVDWVMGDGVDTP